MTFSQVSLPVSVQSVSRTRRSHRVRMITHNPLLWLDVPVATNHIYRRSRSVRLSLCLPWYHQTVIKLAWEFSQSAARSRSKTRTNQLPLVFICQSSSRHVAMLHPPPGLTSCPGDLTSFGRGLCGTGRLAACYLETHTHTVHRWGRNKVPLKCFSGTEHTGTLLQSQRGRRHEEDKQVEQAGAKLSMDW